MNQTNILEDIAELLEAELNEVSEKYSETNLAYIGAFQGRYVKQYYVDAWSTDISEETKILYFIDTEHEGLRLIKINGFKDVSEALDVVKNNKWVTE